ncbi:MAG TPA: cytochrome c oxidase subunit II [Micropepsaceae bacterium]|nr:cytochrome c oxidase subunit II [Micropepsaceae bacterium]
MDLGNLFVEASRGAAEVDTDFLILLLISLLILTLVVTLVLVFAIRYRRGSPAKRGLLPSFMSHEFEIGWTAATAFLFIFIFWWLVAPPRLAGSPQTPALQIQIYAKQWMWKVEHPNGAREINTLHLPLNTPVHLVMTSQDVIHSFYVPAFRVKHDVLPERVSVLDFYPTQTGTFHLFCAEYCGTDHSQMTGDIIVMRPEDYAHWREVQPQSDTLAAEGEALFHSLGCSGCHDPASPVHAPDLRGVYGQSVPLQDGRHVVADDAYIRDCILMPQLNVPAGYPPIMPSFANVVDDSQIERLIAYIRSLRPGQELPK